MIESKSRIPKYTSDAFDNVEYQLRITYTLETDRRIMSFVDSLWGIEVTGGIDQFEPLTIVNVTPTGLARRAGMRIGDEITQINDTPALELTFNEALELFRKTGRYVRVYVRGYVLKQFKKIYNFYMILFYISVMWTMRAKKIGLVTFGLNHVVPGDVISNPYNGNSLGMIVANPFTVNRIVSWYPHAWKRKYVNVVPLLRLLRRRKKLLHIPDP